MNLFELFGKFTHPARRSGWEETTAYFTGESRISRKAGGGYYPLMNLTPPSDLHEYAIRYYTRDEELTGWYVFYPAPDPAPEDIIGTSIRIRSKRSRPWIFENISGMEEEASHL